MRKYGIRLLFPFFLLLFLSGCWNYSELNERTIIAGAAIDLTDSGEIQLTAETIDFGNGDSPSTESKVLTGRGQSIADAVHDIMNQSGKELYWFHATLLVLDNDYAERGIREVLDYILNEHEMRLTLTLAVSRLDTAAEVFDLECHGSKIKSFAITSVIEEQSELGKTVRSDAYDTINRMLEPGAEFALTQIMGEVAGGTGTVDISGCGIFLEDKLTGWLNAEETILLQLLSKSIKRAEFDFPVDDAHLSVNVEDWKVRAEPVVQNHGVEMELHIAGRYEVLLIDGELDVKDPAVAERVAGALGRYLESHLKDLTEYLQEIPCDVFGWGNLLWQRNPEAYRTFPSWYDAFGRIETHVTTDFRSSGGSAGAGILLR